MLLKIENALKFDVADCQGDVFVKGCFVVDLESLVGKPVYYHFNYTNPVGVIKSVAVTDVGVDVVADITDDRITELGSLTLAAGGHIESSREVNGIRYIEKVSHPVWSVVAQKVKIE